MSAPACKFDWCSERHPNHSEHNWHDSVTGHSASGLRPRTVAVWVVIVDGDSREVMVSVGHGTDPENPIEGWLPVSDAEYLRDALGNAIEHARESG